MLGIALNLSAVAVTRMMGQEDKGPGGHSRAISAESGISIRKRIKINHSAGSMVIFMYISGHGDQADRVYLTLTAALELRMSLDPMASRSRRFGRG